MFTIRDFWWHLIDIILAPGEQYQVLLASKPIFAFFEMDATDSGLFWTVTLTGFTYFMLLGGLFFLFGNWLGESEDTKEFSQ